LTALQAGSAASGGLGGPSSRRSNRCWRWLAEADSWRA